jgi:hypothetical protein
VLDLSGDRTARHCYHLDKPTWSISIAFKFGILEDGDQNQNDVPGEQAELSNREREVLLSLNTLIFLIGRFVCPSAGTVPSELCDRDMHRKASVQQRPCVS